MESLRHAPDADVLDGDLTCACVDDVALEEVEATPTALPRAGECVVHRFTPVTASQRDDATFVT